MFVYLEAYQFNQSKPEILNGIAACAYWLSVSESNSRQLITAKELLVNMNNDLLKKMRIGFRPPIIKPIKRKRRKPAQRFTISIHFFTAVGWSIVQLFIFVKSVFFYVFSLYQLLLVL